MQEISTVPIIGSGHPGYLHIPLLAPKTNDLSPNLEHLNGASPSPTRPEREQTCLERVIIKGMEDEGSCVEADAFCDKWRVDWPWVKEVGVVADLAELHQDVDDAHEVPRCQCLLGAERETSHRVSQTQRCQASE